MKIFHDITRVARLHARAFGYAAVAVAALSLSACSDDNTPAPEPDPETPSAGPGKYLMTFNVALASDPVTKGATNTDGSSTDNTVTANEIEARLDAAVIYLMDGNDILCTLYANSNSFTPKSTAGQYTLTAEMELSDLKNLVGKTVKVYLIGNYLENQTNIQQNWTWDPDKTKATFSVDGFDKPIGLFGTSGKIMPLVNHSDFSISFGTLATGASDDDIYQKIKEIFSTYRNNSWVYDVTDELKLERAVARLEYRDLQGRNTTPTPGTGVKADLDLPANTYHVGNLGVYLRLASVQPFNVNKKAYLFRHASAGDNIEASGTPLQLLGDENGTGSGYNWIANPDWSTTAPFTKTPDFINPLKVTETDYTVLGSDDAASTVGLVTVAEFEQAANGDKDGYHPFAYVMENTLPSTSLMKLYSSSTDATTGEVTNTPLLTDYATGVAFRFLVLKADGVTPVTYDEGNKAGFPDEYDWSTEEPDHLIITDTNTAKWVDVAPTVENGKKYYYLTYIACMIHNNPQSGFDPANDKFPPMYYGVVRNNSYQITVSSITSLPLPQDPKTLFLKIKCNVAQWKQRIDGSATLY